MFVRCTDNGLCIAIFAQMLNMIGDKSFRKHLGISEASSVSFISNTMDDSIFYNMNKAGGIGYPASVMPNTGLAVRSIFFVYNIRYPRGGTRRRIFDPIKVSTRLESRSDTE